MIHYRPKNTLNMTLFYIFCVNIFAASHFFHYNQKWGKFGQVFFFLFNYIQTNERNHMFNSASGSIGNKEKSIWNSESEKLLGVREIFFLPVSVQLFLTLLKKIKRIINRLSNDIQHVCVLFQKYLKLLTRNLALWHLLGCGTTIVKFKCKVWL